MANFEKQQPLQKPKPSFRPTTDKPDTTKKTELGRRERDEVTGPDFPQKTWEDDLNETERSSAAEEIRQSNHRF